MKNRIIQNNKVILLVISLCFFNTNVLFAQSKKDIIASLEFTRDSLNGIISNERKDCKIQSQDYNQKKWHYEQQIQESNKIISERDKQLEAKMSFINQLEKSVKEKIIENSELRRTNEFMQDSLKILSELLLEYELAIELNVQKNGQAEREENGHFDHQNSSPDLDLLFFFDDVGYYQIFVNFEESEIRYSNKSGSYKDAEYCFILKNGGIIVSTSSLAYHNQHPTDVFKIVNSELCVYNPENDDYDCYRFERSKSTCDLNKYFK